MALADYVLSLGMRGSTLSDCGWLTWSRQCPPSLEPGSDGRLAFDGTRQNKALFVLLWPRGLYLDGEKWRPPALRPPGRSYWLLAQPFPLALRPGDTARQGAGEYGRGFVLPVLSLPCHRPLSPSRSGPLRLRRRWVGIQ